MHRLTLSVLPEALAICRLDPTEAIPSWCSTGTFYSITRSKDEISVVCPQSDLPVGVRCEIGWRAFKVAGPLDFSLTGVLEALLSPLSEAEISIFAVSTFETDYVLVREADLERALRKLTQVGHILTEFT